MGNLGMKLKSILACLLLAVVGGVWWWVWHDLPKAAAQEGPVARTSTAREPRVQTMKGARAGKRLTPEAGDYETRLNDMLVLSQLGGRARTMELFEQWANEDPKAAFEWATSSPSLGKYIFAAKAVEIMAARDLERAKEMFDTLPESYEKGNALTAISAELAKTDPEAALMYFKEKESGSYVGGALKIIGQAMARNDQDRALELLQQFRGYEGKMTGKIDPLFRHLDFLAGMVEGWGRRDFESMFRWADKLPSGEKIMALNNVGPLWVEFDPQTAMNYLTSLGEDGEATSAIEASLSAWGKLDPEAALQWLESSRLRKNPSYIQSVYRGWIIAQPVQATAALWMSGNEELREALAPDAFEQLLPNSPEEAAKLIPVMREQLQKDTRMEQMEWDARETALKQQLVEQWSYTDRKATEAWINSLDAGETRDMAIHSLIGYIADENPAGAMRWLEKIDDAGQREEIVFKVGAQWLYRDEEAGRQRLAELGVSEEKINRCIQLLDAIESGHLENFCGEEE
jgi:hypothetical protein